ncbi:MAG: hypothetical protein U1C18_03230, partial [Patescibacteria group bacterium]|nr:hypothetical protein [Patescibacteria group bacterium]
MTAAKSSDINLLPGELSGKTKKKPRASAHRPPLVEYTDVSGLGQKPSPPQKKPSLLSRLVSVFSFRKKTEKEKPEAAGIALTSRKDVLPQKKSAPGSAAKSEGTKADLPDGKPLPSGMFAEKKDQPLPPRPPDKAEIPKHKPRVSGVVASQVSAMHMPSVSSGQVAAPRVAPPKAVSTLPGGVNADSSSKASAPAIPVQKEQKKVSWWRALFFRKKTVSRPPVQPQQPVHKEKVQLLPRPAPPLEPMPVKPVAPLPAAQAPVEPQAPVPAKPVSVPDGVPVAQAPKKAEEKPAPPVRTGETEAPVHRVSSFDVDLLTGEYTQAFKKSNPFGVLFAGLGFTALVIAFAYAGLHAYGASASAELKREEQLIAALKETIASYQEVADEDSVLRAKAQLARELIASHVSWHSFLGELEAVTI